MTNAQNAFTTLHSSSQSGRAAGTLLQQLVPSQTGLIAVGLLAVGHCVVATAMAGYTSCKSGGATLLVELLDGACAALLPLLGARGSDVPEGACARALPGKWEATGRLLAPAPSAQLSAHCAGRGVTPPLTCPQTRQACSHDDPALPCTVTGLQPPIVAHVGGMYPVLTCELGVPVRTCPWMV